MVMTPPTVADARQAASALPGSVLLFGSVARGEATPDSDIDLICVVDSVEDRRRGNVGLELSAAAREACSRPVDVIVADWPHWLSWRSLPSTVEHRAWREGMWLRRRPPGPKTDWSGLMVPGQVRAGAVAASLHNTATQLYAALRDMYPTDLEAEHAAGQRADDYWDMVRDRLGGVNADLHIAVEQCFVALCHLIGAPYAAPAHRLQPLYDSLTEYGLTELDSWLDGIDLAWVEQWRSAGSYRLDLARGDDSTVQLGRATATLADHTAGLASTMVSDTTAYTRAVAEISEAVVRIVTQRVERSEVADTDDLRRGIEKVHGMSERLRERLSDSSWLYPGGTQPHGWTPPW